MKIKKKTQQKNNMVITISLTLFITLFGDSLPPNETQNKILKSREQTHKHKIELVIQILPSSTDRNM